MTVRHGLSPNLMRRPIAGAAAPQPLRQLVVHDHHVAVAIRELTTLVHPGASMRKYPGVTAK